MTDDSIADQPAGRVRKQHEENAAGQLDEGMPAGLSPYETAVRLRRWTMSANGYCRQRKLRFRLFSTLTKILVLFLSGASVIILGLQDLDFWAGLGFSLVALTTVVNAVEPFFNWRARWVLAEEAQHRFYRLQEDLEHLVATTRSDSLEMRHLEPMYARYESVWNEFSEKWLERRRSSETSGG